MSTDNSDSDANLDYVRLSRYLAGECTAAERADVETWLAGDPARASCSRRSPPLGRRLDGRVVTRRPPSTARGRKWRRPSIASRRRRPACGRALRGGSPRCCSLSPAGLACGR
jgi:anti-sigma factor RsiW